MSQHVFSIPPVHLLTSNSFLPFSKKRPSWKVLIDSRTSRYKMICSVTRLLVFRRVTSTMRSIWRICFCIASQTAIRSKSIATEVSLDFFEDEAIDSFGQNLKFTQQPSNLLEHLENSVNLRSTISAKPKPKLFQMQYSAFAFLNHECFSYMSDCLCMSCRVQHHLRRGNWKLWETELQTFHAIKFKIFLTQRRISTVWWVLDSAKY